MTKTATGFKPTYSSNIEDEAADSILKQKLSPAVVRELLEIIPVDELTKLGIDPLTWDPEQLVMKNVLVPPPIVRPSVTNECGLLGLIFLPETLGQPTPETVQDVISGMAQRDRQAAAGGKKGCCGR